MNKPGFDLKVFLLVVLLHVILYAVFIGDQWLRQSLTREMAMNESMFGEQLAQISHDRGTRWFTASLVEPRIVEHSFMLVIPTAEQKRQSRGLESLGTVFFDWAEQRLRVFWTLVYQSFLRVANVMLWFPYVLFLLVPFVVDGLVQRRIKQTNFDYTSPLRYTLSLRLIGYLGLAFFLLIFAPIPMPPVTVPIFMVCACACLGMLAANTIKRV